MKTKLRSLLPCFLLCVSFAHAQLGAPPRPFTRADTLRGTIMPERAWWDVLHYSILVKPDYNNKSIAGKVDMRFKAVKDGRRMQIDLQEPMELTKAYYKDKAIPYTREGNVYYLVFPQNLAKGTVGTLALAFKGNPRIAKRPPWDGGWIFQKDKLGRPWMSVACQGLGASVWYPCKDHQSDEPDNGATLAITVPDTLVAVANGRLVNKQSFEAGTITWKWEVKNPINNYNLVPYIGKYVTWHEDFAGEKGKLDCDYWVLDYELDRAKVQFKQAKEMLTCFEHWMGPYPFYEDGYKLVQSPHLGMEHQSAVAYGNGFQNGYLGRDQSGTGWGLKWDFIIVHESGHEWFANNITSKDLADMWIHEGFTNYSETLFTECQSGKQAGNEYNYGSRRGIHNDRPIIARYGVNKEGSGDMYPKSGNMLHSIRHAVNDDEKFRGMLRFLNKRFYHQTVTTEDIQSEMSKFLGLKVNRIFDQYLRTTQVPVFEYAISPDKTKLEYRWTNCIDGFDLPVYVQSSKGLLLLSPESNKWNTKELKPGEPIPYDFDSIEKNYYVTVQRREQVSGN
ncbi:M1 family metallopeptidase [Sediminibacterium soli]|uniref:M1 family metallopeptidase n=1 Tax=Sediminibacterium soli TaxID=2698829 RepID=UPI00137955AF|nr:M1 family metallopeptidase [Sediminibacterium soli]NCI46264.1 M1 family metallopeptidase [Sediminibacterium soli]